MCKLSRNALTHLAKRYRAVLRRCRLRALALACACALTTLPPLPAGANSGGEVETDYLGYPAYIGSTTGSDGHVIIDSGFGGSVHGGHTTAPGTDATDNTVIISGGTVTMHVYGGTSQNGSAHNNTTIISGGTVNGDVYGGITVNGNADGNTVIISGGTVAGSVSGGHSVNGNADGNTVIISGGTVNGNVYCGVGTNAANNTVILSGAPTLTGIIFGGDAFVDAVSGNRLILLTSGLTALNVANFEQYAFHLPADIRPGDVLLTLTGLWDVDLTNFGKSPSPDIQRIDVDVAASPLRVGDTVTLLKSASGLKAGTLPESVSGTQGVTLAYTFALSTTSNTLDATVSDTHVNPQTKALSEGHVSGTALALQGADLAAGKGMEAAGQAVRASRAGGGKGVAAFGALSGGWSRYNTGSHIDVSGFSLLTGLAWGADSVLGQFTTGMFFEYGSAASTTFNSFSNAASVSGDGSTWYMGAGLLARMDFNDCGPGHFYAEASGRAGALKNDYRNDDLRDDSGRRADFETTTPYVSLHGGLGYIWNLTDALSLDLHAKYFWTWQDGADTDLSTGEALHFDAVNSHRLRLGGRLTYSVNEHVSPYVGAAWEHEFDGTARATSRLPRGQSYTLDAPSLTGDTGMGELGLSWTPSATTPLTIDLSVQGYTGVRQGYTGSLMAKWEF